MRFLLALPASARLCLALTASLAALPAAAEPAPLQASAASPTFRYSGDAALSSAILARLAEALARQGLHLQDPQVRLSGLDGLRDGMVLELPAWQPPGREPVRLPLRLTVLAGTQRGQATVTGRLKQDLLVLRRAMARGAAVRCADLSLEQRPVDLGRQGWLPAPCALAEGTVLRRPLGAGDALRAADVGARPAVAEMERVSIRVQAGAVVLESAGIALADAELGEPVRVRPHISRQTVAARVIGPQAVVVEPGAMP
ncbi:flagellar basal body P-ring formation chaperone FlgA [Aquabacterium sp. A7-Y]|uniref:flagellar basal body P-ring formation chaperone FlgA n=1 Tax=Aquabacterium sp. A7-Y TaxID=1349605 RepID=UPI00223DB7E9|nr:flagellar basal body P-ring formation chaperone FlgA [Aquabacterium sp. A7-Y]MCW7540881.1 flagellar basal body P-ring formation chaperone FlgA [Aquabacterium sp. A7-Y]